MTYRLRNPDGVQTAAARLDPPRASGTWHHLVRLRSALEHAIRDHLPEQMGTLVDLGCGEIPYRPLFAPRVRRYVAVDLPGNPNAEVEFGDDGAAPLDAGVADVVFSCQVLEHVESPGAYLAECDRLLRPGGRILLTTHGHFRYHPDPHDFWRFTSEGLRRTIERQGWRVVDFAGVVSLGGAGLQLLQDDLVVRAPARIRPLLFRLFQAAIRFVDRLAMDHDRRTDAGTFVVVAEKPENGDRP